MSLLIIIILVIVIGIVLYIYYKKKESFRPSFVQRMSDKQERRMNSSEFVQIQERGSGMFLTFNDGRIQLRPRDIRDINQFWLYFPDGVIMSAKDKLCLTWTGYDFPPGPEICTGTAGQKFLLQDNGQIINLTGLPYYDRDRPDRILEQKKRCLSAQYATNDTSIRIPIITECEKTTTRWNIYVVPSATFYGALTLGK